MCLLWNLVDMQEELLLSLAVLMVIRRRRGLWRENRKRAWGHAPDLHDAMILRHMQRSWETWSWRIFLITSVSKGFIRTFHRNSLQSDPIHWKARYQNETGYCTVMQTFPQIWQFPKCLDFLDGTNMLIHPSAYSCSIFCNYKHSFSIVLMILVDADYHYLFASIGFNGREVCLENRNSPRLCSLVNSTYHSPPQCPMTTPYTIYVRGRWRFSAKKKSTTVIWPKTSESLIYKLSRARRCVKNAFGIMANHFRVFIQPPLIIPDLVEIVLAACALHNLWTHIGLQLPNEYDR